MWPAKYALSLFLLISGVGAFVLRSMSITRSLRVPTTLNMVSIGSKVPAGAKVDVIVYNGKEIVSYDNQDAGEVLSNHKLCILFSVPGAFTPTCSEKHLPGFIEKAKEFEEKGVEAVYCMSVNDRFVMKAWGSRMTGYGESGINLIADGNGDLAKALGLTKDATGSRMGVRSSRFAAILENGVVKALFQDEKGLDKSSAENVLANL